MKKRLELKVTGMVQRVGYRNRVDNTAYELQITGTVENLKDRSVKIVGEGEASSLEEFIKKITINEDYIKVKKVAVVNESKPTGKFVHFEIIRGDMVEELKGSFDLGLEKLRASTNEIKEEIKDSKKVLQAEIKDSKEEIIDSKNVLKAAMKDSKEVFKSEIQGVGSHLSGRLDTANQEASIFREQTHTDLEQTHADFKELDFKYDRVSKTLESIDKHVQDVSEVLKTLGEALLKSVEKDN